MTILFSVAAVAQLPQAKLVVADGVLEQGIVRVGDMLRLTQGERSFGLEVHGIVLGSVPGKLSLAFRLQQEGAQLLEPGDVLTNPSPS